ncbi:uncharacterized protein PADG_06500 [Paracoccidioides brasiliensis Pb18]|uniref:Delta 8-(E)-sphingolipid desaturase n=1 Tax=Paracoccidioides brasiliensis (strain Pb18) TaxID=502780 RepID=C1GGR3_PARBD|nr:uncharacterized protein PADG_06500 [Paracoccidioides brasiliensis Pb18]EEH50421.2 hypothetical protein PADG_06500 [Paracoccidioides brasiliensis Pb18]
MSSQSFKSSACRKDRVFSRREIEGLIADGRHIIILEGKVLMVDAWIKFHPGGDKSIMHMVGRDATDEVTALHSPEALQRMDSFQIGRYEGRWLNFLPPIQGGKFLPYHGKESDICEAPREDLSEPDITEPPSPIFEPVEGISRLRGPASSISSVSSNSPIELPDPKRDSRPLFLDARTQQEIVIDLAKYPPLDTKTQDFIVEKYRALHEQVKAEGLYNCNYFAYLIELSRCTLLGALSLYFLFRGWYATSGLFLGLMWHQLVFTAHDAGHMGITHNFHLDTVLGIIVADFIGGLSLGWWKRNHNVHHIVTNSPEHDPDIEHMPFFAISHRFFDGLRSTYYDRIMAYDAVAKFLVRYQHFLYYPVLAFGRFNLYRLSWEYLLRGQAPQRGPAWWHRWFEIAGQLFFWTWFGYGVIYLNIPDWPNRLLFILVSHSITMPLHVQITLSHFAMSTADLGVHESFPQKMLRTTMDVDCPQWLDFFHGGLQFQAVHHLFPRMPRHNLRRSQKLVMQFCKEVKVPYAIFTFFDGNKEVIGRLGDVAKQARLLAECQRRIAEQGGAGHAHTH